MKLACNLLILFFSCFFAGTVFADSSAMDSGGVALPDDLKNTRHGYIVTQGKENFQNVNPVATVDSSGKVIKNYGGSTETITSRPVDNCIVGYTPVLNVWLVDTGTPYNYGSEDGTCYSTKTFIQPGTISYVGGAFQFTVNAVYQQGGTWQGKESTYHCSHIVPNYSGGVISSKDTQYIGEMDFYYSIFCMPHSEHQSQ